MAKNTRAKAKRAAARAQSADESYVDESKSEVKVHYVASSEDLAKATPYEREMLANAVPLPTEVLVASGALKKSLKACSDEEEDRDTLYDSLEGKASVYGSGPNYFLCRPNETQGELSLGEASVSFARNRYGGDRKQPAFGNIVQVVMGGKIQLMSCGRRIPLWFVYTKDRVYTHSDDMCLDNAFEPIAQVWGVPDWPLPPQIKRYRECDVLSTVISLPGIIQPLTQHADATQDRPIPRYQMIVDPNQFVHDGQWIASEFDISASGKVGLVGGEASHAYPSLAAQVAVPVLEAALPMLARLRRPALLLPNQRIQAVFKAQRIILPPASSSSSSASSASSASSSASSDSASSPDGPLTQTGSPSEYIGLWHMDGDTEHVVAVVLYYYHVHPSLSGGDLEFMGREPHDVLGYGDCSNNLAKYDSKSKEMLRRALGSKSIVRCRTPITTGSLVVFSNYQMIHRVLKMINTSPEEASRDFVALFIIDPLHPLKTARSVLQRQTLLQKTLSGIRLPSFPSPSTPLSSLCRLPAAVANRILEFCGVVLSREQKMAQRNRLLRQQLRPKGKFGNAGYVYSTGNGCFTMIGWLDSLLAEDTSFGHQEQHRGLLRTQMLNRAPVNVGRGVSEILSMTTMTNDNFELDGDVGMD